jgi:hypothetical protein
MSKVIPLAFGQITPHHTITIELVQPAGEPGAVFIRWPDEPTRVSPHKLSEAMAAACRILANGSTELARLKAGQKP